MSVGQARAIAATLAFLDADNAGRGDVVIGIDCDDGSGVAVPFAGRDQAAMWVRDRAADRDQLTLADIADIANEHPDQRAGARRRG